MTARRFLPGLQNLDYGHNYMRMVLSPGPFRNAIGNWPDAARAMMIRVRRAASRGGSAHPELWDLYDEARFYAKGIDLESSPDEDPVVRIDLVLEKKELCVFTLGSSLSSSLGTTLSDHFIELMYPHNTATEEFFRAA